MQKLTGILLLSAGWLHAITGVGSVTVTDTSGVARTGALRTVSRVFKQGDIANYPKPNGLSVSPMWQATVLSSWRDGSQTCTPTAVTGGTNSASDPVKVTCANTWLPGEHVTVTFSGMVLGGGLGSNVFVVENSDAAHVVLMNSSVTSGSFSSGSVTGPGPGSVKMARISWFETLGANASDTIAFVNSTDPSSSGDAVQTALSSGLTTIAFLQQQPWAYTATINGSDVITGVTPIQWDADMEFTNGTTVTADAQTMLGALSLASNQVRYWDQGPVTTEVYIEDRSTALSQDIAIPNSLTCPAQNPNPCKSGHPYFMATYIWNQNPVKVEAIFEDEWASKLQPLTYSLNIKTGVPLTSQYTKATFTQLQASRWHKTFWSGTAPGSSVTDFNVAYMVASGAIPNYDVNSTYFTPTCSSTEINFLTLGNSTYGGRGALGSLAWNNSDKGDIGGQGMLDKHFSDTGWRSELGWLEEWSSAWLFCMSNATNNAALYPLIFGNADVSGNVPIHVQEDDNSRLYNVTGSVSAFGHPISTSARPTINSFWTNTNSTAVGDLITPLTPVNCEATGQQGIWWGCDNAHKVFGTSGWAPDMAHQAPFGYMAYLTSAEPYYKQDLYDWVALDSAPIDYTCTWQFGHCGKFGIAGMSNVETRGWAWTMVHLDHTCFLGADADVEKNYACEKQNYNFAALEGQYNITNGSYYNTTTNSAWERGFTIFGRGTGWSDDNPLHQPFFQSGAPLGQAPSFANSGCDGFNANEDSSATCSANSAFQLLMGEFFLGQAERHNSNLTKINDFIASWTIGHILNPAAIPYDVTTYSEPTLRISDGKYFHTWTEQSGGYLASWKTSFDQTKYPVTDSAGSPGYSPQDPDGGYIAILGSALAQAYSRTTSDGTGSAAWTWWTNSLASAQVSGLLANMGIDSKWAVVPLAPLSNCAISPLSEPPSTVGQPISWFFSLSGCGAGPFTWSNSGTALPTGLSMCPASGSSCTISGTVSAAGTFTPTIAVTDGGSNSATDPLTLTVNAAPTISTSSLPNATQGQSYTQTLTSSGGTGAITFAFAAGFSACLNGSGITLASNGTLSGTASTPATYPCQFQATDANNITGPAKALSLQVVSATALGGTAVSGQVKVSGQVVLH